MMEEHDIPQRADVTFSPPQDVDYCGVDSTAGGDGAGGPQRDGQGLMSPPFLAFLLPYILSNVFYWVCPYH